MADFKGYLLRQNMNYDTARHYLNFHWTDFCTELAGG